MVLGNLSVAILVRNEVFGRILYLFVNTCFAKVCPVSRRIRVMADFMTVATTVVPPGVHIYPPGTVVHIPNDP